MVSVHKAIGTIRVPLEIHGVATGISQTVLRQKVVVCPVIPSRTGSADIRGTEPLGKRPCSIARRIQQTISVTGISGIFTLSLWCRGDFGKPARNVNVPGRELYRG